MGAITDLIAKHEHAYGHTHAHGTLDIHTIREFEELAGDGFTHSIETGCGKSTILLSNVSARHTCFCIDDRFRGARSSVNYFMNCAYTRHSHVETVYGATQSTLPAFSFREQICFALIDGPHGYPFPELEYYFIYPHIRQGGYLVIDDIHIPTLTRLAEFLAEDDMFELVKVIGKKTAIYERTGAPALDPYGDNWWVQKYNRRRVPKDNPYYLADAGDPPPPLL